MEAAPAVQPRVSGSLYVGDLPIDLPNPEDALFNLFNKIGMVMSIKVCRDINTQRSLGYAYVNFQNPADAERAISELNYAEIRPERSIRIMWSTRDPTLRKNGAGNIFVKNLDPSVDTRTLRDTFAVFGTILSCKLAMDDTGASRGYGFVHFDKEESATEAVERVNGMEIGGSKVIVSPFIKKADREKEAEKTFISIYMKNLKEDLDEAGLTEVLAKFGEVESLYLSGHPQHKTKFALVAMKEHASALAVIENLHQSEDPNLAATDNKAFVCRALKKRDRLAAKAGDATLNLYQSQGRNIYIKHLDDGVTKEKVEGLFEQFGAITSSTLMVDAAGNFRGFGFVCFEAKEAATAAIREMNGKLIFRRPLYVAQAQQKDMRHQMLEEQRKSMMAQQQRMSMGMGMPGGYWGMGPRNGGFMPSPMMGAPFMMGGPHMRRGPNPRFPVRNLGPKVPPQMPMQRYTQQPPPPARTQQQAMGVTAATLAKMSPEEQKNALGERLYAKIQGVNPQQAAKITGMLLEMDTPEVLNVLEDHNLLMSKVNEAVAVLQQHSGDGN